MTIEHGNHLLHGALRLPESKAPFPWQKRLLDHFRAGAIPSELDIPTGLGKTAVMAIWLVARLLGADVPRRLIYVVDRRAVVDQATTVAEQLRRWVSVDDERRERLGLADGCELPISTLRGQFVDNREWLADPAAPAIVVGTVDMVGSRMLFGGYGVSRKMRPYHAAMLCCDALLVLDEAHLVPPFEALVRDVSRRVSNGPALVPSLRVLSLSATGRAPTSHPFMLEADDFEDQEVDKRLNAEKALSVVDLEKGKKLPAALAEAALELADASPNPVRCVVFCDRRQDADEVAKLLGGKASRKSKGKGSEVAGVQLLVGARRVRERVTAARNLEKLGFLGDTSQPPNESSYLVATSAGEVGIDVDADHMVCDVAAWERMVQRLGRVNRRGGKASRVVVVVEPAQQPKALAKDVAKRSDKEKAEVEAFETHQRRLELLSRLRRCSDGKRFDASPASLIDLKQRAASEPGLAELLRLTTSREPLRPELSLPPIEAWSMTSLEEHAGRPQVAPWLRGWADERPQTTVVWRRYLLREPTGAAPVKQTLRAFFEAAPPHTSEYLETELDGVQRWLKKRVARLDRRRQDPAEDLEALRAMAAVTLGSSGEAVAWSLEALASKRASRDLERALAGGTLVLDARFGGLDDNGLLSDSNDELPETADTSGWQGDVEAAPIAPFRIREEGEEERANLPPGWKERARFAAERDENGEVTKWLVIDRWRHDAATEDDRSAARSAQSLAEHHDWTAKQAAGLAARLGLAPPHGTMLIEAARMHDAGKATLRWQRAFRAPRGDGPWAKTRGPIDQALLDGYRHELGSLLRAESAASLSELPPALRDLALHLIAAHHGYARPILPTRACDDAPPSALEERAREVAVRFARLQRQWGPWGLAWWETLLRAADQLASAENDDAASAGKAAE